MVTPIEAEKKDDILEKSIKNMLEKPEIVDENAINISIWDFGGDVEFYYTHQIFLAKEAVFLVVTRLDNTDKFAHGKLFIERNSYIFLTLQHIYSITN